MHCQHAVSWRIFITYHSVVSLYIRLFLKMYIYVSYVLLIDNSALYQVYLWSFNVASSFTWITSVRSSSCMVIFICFMSSFMNFKNLNLSCTLEQETTPILKQGNNYFWLRAKATWEVLENISKNLDLINGFLSLINNCRGNSRLQSNGL